jgi:hypothetical protein
MALGWGTRRPLHQHPAYTEHRAGRTDDFRAPEYSPSAPYLNVTAMSFAISLRARSACISGGARGRRTAGGASRRRVARRPRQAERDRAGRKVHLARERLGEVVDVSSTQSWLIGAYGQERVHFWAPPLYAPVAVRMGLPRGGFTDMVR